MVPKTTVLPLDDRASIHRWLSSAPPNGGDGAEPAAMNTLLYSVFRELVWVRKESNLPRSVRTSGLQPAPVPYRPTDPRVRFSKPA